MSGGWGRGVRGVGQEDTGTTRVRLVDHMADRVSF